MLQQRGVPVLFRDASEILAPALRCALATAVFLLDRAGFGLGALLTAESVHAVVSLAIGRGVIDDGSGVIASDHAVTKVLFHDRHFPWLGEVAVGNFRELG